MKGCFILNRPAGSANSDVVTVDTIRRFKGLESPVIVLIVDYETAQSPEMSYIAVSRAQSRLYVYGEVNGTCLGTAVS